MKITYAAVKNIIQIGYRRLRRFAVAGVLLIVIAQIWHTTTQQSRQQLTEHTQQLARMTVDQASYHAAYWLLRQDTEALSATVNSLEQQPNVLSASIQNQFGQQITSAGQESSMIGWQRAAENNRPLAIVAELKDDNRIIGYLHVVFDYHQLLRQPEQTHLFLTQRGRSLLLLAAIAGILFMASFNRIRYRPKAS